MTGWRMGYLCAPAGFTDVMCKIHQYAIMCAPRQGQVAALEALRRAREDGCRDVIEMRQSYDRRRRLMVQAFRDMGLSCFEPLGAVLRIPRHPEDRPDQRGVLHSAFCKRRRSSAVPGTAFGPSGEGHIRCCYATALSQAQRGAGAHEALP